MTERLPPPLLILSSRRVEDDIALQYGALPPSFLPLGNKRLFELQVELAGGAPVAMTVPVDFDIPPVDMATIERLGIQLLPQPQSLSLTGAIAEALGTLGITGPLQLLYGDTLVRMNGQPMDRDLLAVQHTSANYQWAYVTDDGNFSDARPDRLDTRQIVCGYYLFQDAGLLADICAGNGIVTALNTYNAQRPFALVEASDWYDFGHLPLYFQSKKDILIKRDFNSLVYENHLLIKQSRDTAKMRAEAHWYEHLPADLHIHTPRYRGRVERNHLAGYAVEYLYHPLISDLAAFGALPLTSWLEILAACFDVFDKCRAIRPDAQAPEAAPEFATAFHKQMVIDKTWDRLTAYAAHTDLDLDAGFSVNGRRFGSLRDVVGRAMAAVPVTTPDDIRFWHGDMFFGNMFYDFTARRILAIDPRGLSGGGQLCLYGDWRYDLAKLAHSVIGQYDKIILGRSRLDEHGPRDWTLHLSQHPHQAEIEEIFLSQVSIRYGLAQSELVALTALLFFSMLPLHGDRPDLQRHMLANALRLAGGIDGGAE